MITFKRKAIGEYNTNSYLLISSEDKKAALIDPAAQADDLLAWCKEFKIEMILLTHGHSDHIGALNEVRTHLDVPVGIHPMDSTYFELESDFELNNNDQLQVGGNTFQVVHIPGHTPGSVAFQPIDDLTHWVIVGDAIFPGGPGHTKSPQDLEIALKSLARTVFQWDDDIELYPGHGDFTTVGAERASFEIMRERPLPPDLCGDVTWR